MDPASLSQDLEVVRHGRLAHIAASREVAGAYLCAIAQLAEDGQPGRIGGRLEEQDIRIGLAFHGLTVLTDVYLDKYQYITRQHRVTEYPER